MTIQDIQSLAEAHGLLLTDKMNFNEMGIDFKVVFALDTKGQQWLLRIPRRDGMREQIKKEKRILELVKKHLSVEVPDWRISSTELVAYPILKDNPVLNLDAETYEIIWNMDKDSPKYITSLAKTLFEIRHCCKVSDEAAFCLIQRPYISKTLLTRRISPRGSP